MIILQLFLDGTACERYKLNELTPEIKQILGTYEKLLDKRFSYTVSPPKIGADIKKLKEQRI